MHSVNLPLSSNWADNYLYHAFKAEQEEEVIEALKLTKGWYNADRWKGDRWFNHLDALVERFPATRPYVMLDEAKVE